MATVAQEILRLARRGAGGHVCVANVHMLVEARRDAAMREVMERAALVVSDGRPLVWQLRRHGFAQAQPGARAGADDPAVRGGRGRGRAGLLLWRRRGADGRSSRARCSTQSAGAADRRHRGGADAAAAAGGRRGRPSSASARSGARLVFVGLGCPKQEFWMAAYRAPSRRRAGRRRPSVRHRRRAGARGAGVDARASAWSGCSASPPSRAGCGAATW